MSQNQFDKKSQGTLAQVLLAFSAIFAVSLGDIDLGEKVKEF
jgi:hypothetical protein